MTYDLKITERAEKHIEDIIIYILQQLKNPSAANAILNDIEEVYITLKQDAGVFALCENPYLASKGYHKLQLKHHNYVIIYVIDGDEVTIMGVFHTLENYLKKL